MTFDVQFEMDPMTLNVGFGEIVDLKKEDAEKVYQEGYEKGEAIGKETGYANGYETGYESGKTDGYNEGVSASYETGYNDGLSSGEQIADSIIDRSIAGAYRNDKVTHVGNYAFYDCNGLTAVDFPLATSIGDSAFSICTSLAAVDFPMVTSISDYAFISCIDLEKLILRRTSDVCKLYSANALGGTGIKLGRGYIYVPDDLVDSYKAATNWSTFADQIKPLSELEE